ncbi:373_t:CDS:2, partial [Racocetra fulgida]
GIEISAVREVKVLRELRHPNIIEISIHFRILIRFNLHKIKDMKPNNLLVGRDGQLKIADFGLARDFAEPRVRNIWYRAPELFFTPAQYGYAVDIWSVGCIFAELMLRTPYLPGDTDLGQLELIFQALGTPTEEDWP